MTANLRTYATPDPTVPSQNTMVTSRVLMRDKYAIIPASVLVNITSSNLPYWQNTRCWVLTTPDMGYGCHFAQYMVYTDVNGGSDEPEFEDGVESFLFVCEGNLTLGFEQEKHQMTSGGFAYIPPNKHWSIRNSGENLAKFLWLRKQYEPIRGLTPSMFIGNENDVPQVTIEGFDGKGRSQYLFPQGDMAYDMCINLNNWDPGALIPVVETHVMEHGLYMLQGQGMYLLNDEWYEVCGGDYIWMAPFCPQTFYCGGSTTGRYLLYKNVNRQFPISDH